MNYSGIFSISAREKKKKVLEFVPACVCVPVCVFARKIVLKNQEGVRGWERVSGCGGRPHLQSAHQAAFVKQRL